ncbi:hypothetical protein Sste5346_004946 [Sporothrix stenoceras]|uniref:Ankyrin repeat protein n=1 Tax=Sporothrix stenoceras TaxID=5173 RepID=A0ABR3Z8J6_9PEZI
MDPGGMTPADVTAAREQLAVLRRSYDGIVDRAADRQERLESLHKLHVLCPALSDTAKYGMSKDIYYWGQVLHLHRIIQKNDLVALRELMQVNPRLLTLEDPSENRWPPLVEAVHLGRLEILRVLLKHRATMSPEDLVSFPHHQYEDDGYRGNWGTPLTTACEMARPDIVKMLLDGMPDVDINEPDYLGFTPFTVAAAGQQRVPFAVVVPPPEIEAQTRDRLAILRLLIKNGADVHGVRAWSLNRGETLDTGYDRELARQPFTFRTRPGGKGNALMQAMQAIGLDNAVLRFLVEEAGVSPFQSCATNVAFVGFSTEAENQKEKQKQRGYDFDRAFITPLGAGARFGNAQSVAFLLSLLSEDDQSRLLTATDDSFVTVPEPRPAAWYTGDMPVLLPLHAALLGKSPLPAQWDSNNVAAAIDTVRVFTTNAAIRKATINAAYRGKHTPFHMATSFDRIPLMLELIKLGADAGMPRADGHGIVLALFASASRLARNFGRGCGFLGRGLSGLVDVSSVARIDGATDMAAVLKALLDRYRPRGVDLREDMQNAQTRRALINEADTNGNTPLHFSMAYGLQKSTAALLAMGARTNAVNKAGMVPFTPAQGTDPDI